MNKMRLESNNQSQKQLIIIKNFQKLVKNADKSIPEISLSYMRYWEKKGGKRKRKLLPKKMKRSWMKAHINTWKLNWNISMITDVLDQKRRWKLITITCNWLFSTATYLKIPQVPGLYNSIITTWYYKWFIFVPANNIHITFMSIRWGQHTGFIRSSSSVPNTNAIKTQYAIILHQSWQRTLLLLSKYVQYTHFLGKGEK